MYWSKPLKAASEGDNLKRLSQIIVAGAKKQCSHHVLRRRPRCPTPHLMIQNHSNPQAVDYGRQCKVLRGTFKAILSDRRVRR